MDMASLASWRAEAASCGGPSPPAADFLRRSEPARSTSVSLDVMTAPEATREKKITKDKGSLDDDLDSYFAAKGSAEPAAAEE